METEFIAIVLEMLAGNRWLIDALEKQLITTHKLRKLFGITTEKADNRKKLLNIPPKLINDVTEEPEINNSSPPVKEKAKGHGCMGAAEYPTAAVVKISLDNLKAYDPCPIEDCDGTVYQLKDPGIFIQVTGSPIATATRYELEKLRCGLCGIIFTAQLPAEVSPVKYTNNFIAMLMIHKYYAAMPFYRQEQLQRNFGIPLPSSTQWDLINRSTAPFVKLYDAFKEIVANAKGICIDDTYANILEVTINNKKATAKKDRKGCYTTGIIGVNDDHNVYLYLTDDEPAGKSVTPILSKRDPNLPKPFMMCDALTANIPKAIASDLYNLCFCLVHARRNFYDLPDGYDDLAETVIVLISRIYDVEDRTKSMNGQARLQFHQEHSTPLMLELKTYLEKELPNHEPNGIAYRAIIYLLKRWTELSQFLRYPGTPIDNNLTEQMLKIPIRLRKSSLFNKTKHGAKISSYIISAIYTAVRNEINPYHYLLAILDNKDAVIAEPQRWLPWNYAKLNAHLFEEGSALQEGDS